MAAKKSQINEALRPAHLQAIGRVAAQWNSLELTILLTLSRVAKIDLGNLVTFVGSQNVTAWCEMLPYKVSDY